MELNKLHGGLTYDQYSNFCMEQKALRSSYLKHLMKSARHLKSEMDAPDKPSDAMNFGKLVHSLFENPMDFLARHVVKPKFMGRTLDGKMSDRSKEAKEKEQEWLSKRGTEDIVVTQEEAERLFSIHNMLKEKNMISNILRKGVKEQSLWVKDPETGVTLACRPDFIAEDTGYCIDLKTTRDASPGFFTNEIFSTKGRFYLLQSSHYTHCLKTAGVSDGKAFIFIAIENLEPFDMRVYAIDEGALSAGDEWRKRLTEQYAECLETDIWPGYPDTCFPTTIPSWFNDPPEVSE